MSKRWLAAALVAAGFSAAALFVLPAEAAGKKSTAAKAASKPVAKSAAKAAAKRQGGSKSGVSRGAAPAKKKNAAGPVMDSVQFLSVESSGLSGSASFYGHGFKGRRVATGERFDVNAFTAASNAFPLGSWVVVRRLDNGRCVVVKINDRMAGHRTRILDLTRAAAEHLQMISAGVVMVRAALLRGGHGKGGGAAERACHQAFASEPAEMPATGLDLRAEPALKDSAGEIFSSPGSLPSVQLR